MNIEILGHINIKEKAIEQGNPVHFGKNKAKCIIADSASFIFWIHKLSHCKVLIEVASKILMTLQLSIEIKAQWIIL